MDITKESIAEWKAKYGDIFKITARNSGRSVVIRKPGLKELDAALVAGSNGGLGFSKIIYNNCAIAKDEGITDDDLMAIYTEIGRVITIPEADVEKL
jgi:hypothetical protein